MGRTAAGVALPKGAQCAQKNLTVALPRPDGALSTGCGLVQHDADCGGLRRVCYIVRHHGQGERRRASARASTGSMPPGVARERLPRLLIAQGEGHLNSAAMLESPLLLRVRQIAEEFSVGSTFDKAAACIKRSVPRNVRVGSECDAFASSSAGLVLDRFHEHAPKSTARH